MMLGFVGGGLIAEAYNWRIALISVGAPGLLLAVVMARSLQEPARGTFETETPPPPPPILTSAATMWANPAMRHLIAGSVVAGLLSYGFTQWLPTFFITVTRPQPVPDRHADGRRIWHPGVDRRTGLWQVVRSPFPSRLPTRYLDACRGSLCHPALLHRRLTGGQPGHGNSVVHYSGLCG